MTAGVWAERSWAVIGEIHASLPPDATLKQRKDALKEGYPFGEKSMFPYKAWCKAKRQYLARYQPPKPIPDSLLELWK